MARHILIWFVASVYVTCMCQAITNDIGRLNKKVKRCIRKTKDLRKEVNDLRTTVDYCFTDVQDMKTKMNKTITTLDNLSEKQKEVEAENLALKFNITEIQNDYAQMKTELTKLQASCSTTPPTQSPQQTTTPATTTPFLHTCDEGWRNFNGHCYLFILGEVGSWDNALAFCENRNSYLIEITTDAEREFAHELVSITSRNMFWIGATDTDIEDGLFVYRHSRQRIPDNYWREGQPDNFNGIQHCFYMMVYDDLELLDGTCSYPSYFVCEKP